ncbi:hypothetical protein C0989_011702 [Termitomyces sp. Mn162]|nr:hypothetical protein C0989_011702 [Termitomyces sp. Mn162]
MSDEITKFEAHRAKLAASLNSVAESMKTTAALAESFAAMVKDSSFVDGEKKSRKRKGAAEDGDDKATKRKRKLKDPNAPKRPASSYIMFQNDIRKDLKEKNPHLSNPDLLALISQKWSEMSEEDKAVYTKANASAKEQYSNEKKAYEARSPEEVAAANAAAEAALAVSIHRCTPGFPRLKRTQAKKSKPRARAPKAPAASTTPATTAGASASPPIHSNSNSSDEDEDGSETSEGEDDEVPKKAAPVQISDSDEESDEEEESSEEEEKPKMKVKTPVKVKEKEGKAGKGKHVAAPEKEKKKKAAKQ